MGQRRVSDLQAGRTRDLRPVRGASGDGLAGVAAVLPVVRAGLAQIIKQRPDPKRACRAGKKPAGRVRGAVFDDGASVRPRDNGQASGGVVRGGGG